MQICPNCQATNREDNRFCISCGTALSASALSAEAVPPATARSIEAISPAVVAPVPASASTSDLERPVDSLRPPAAIDQPAGLSKGNKIIGSAAAIALMCFFLPWVLVSCEDQPVASFSGWQLATGGTVQTSMGAQPFPLEASPVLFLVLLAAAACLALVYFLYQRRIALRKAAYAAIGLAGLSLLILLVKFAGAQAQPPQAGSGIDVQLRLQYGFWGTVLANLAIIAGAVVALREGERQSEPVSEELMANR